MTTVSHRSMITPALVTCINRVVAQFHSGTHQSRTLGHVGRSGPTLVAVGSPVRRIGKHRAVSA